MHKKLKKDVNITGITSSGMLMRLLATRPSGLTTVEAAKREAVLENSQARVSVMRDGFLRLIGADQIVPGDILVLAASEKTPVTIATVNKDVNVIEAGEAVTEMVHGVVLDATVGAKAQTSKVRVGSTFMMAVAALVSFCAVLMVNQFAFMGLATLVVGAILLTMIKLVNLGQIKVAIDLNDLPVSERCVQVSQQIKPVVRVFQELLVHAGNAEIPQPVLA